MSYILDALKRAETERERERGAVPTLGSSSSTSTPAARNLLVPVLIVLVLLLAVAALYAWLRPSAPPAVHEIVREAAPPPPMLVAPPPLVRPAPVATAPAATPQPVPAPATTTTRTTTAQAAAVPALAELPAATRQGMPPLNVNGAVNAPAPADRLLFVNGQVLHEGDNIAPDLRVETIGVHSAQLSWRGQRFRVDY